MSSHSVRQEFDAELQELKLKVLAMGGMVEAMVEQSLEALVSRDTAKAENIQERDADVDRIEMEIDELATRILARRQPAASDLRAIIAAIKVSTDLERMGDLAVNISERVVDLNSEPQLKPYIDLPRMGEKTQAMIREALDSFVGGDVEKARAVLVADQVVDDLNENIFMELKEFMARDPQCVNRATALLFVSKYLERVADHATNVAEDVIFAIEGVDVRHGNAE